jgi:thimet oligopeptidase
MLNADSALSFDVYKGHPQDVNLEALYPNNLKRFSDFDPLPGTHYYAGLPHLSSYSSTVYTYLWDQVIAEDFFLQFDQHNLLAGGPAMRYRHVVLEPGGSISANDLVKNFLGRPQNTSAFRHWISEEFESDSAPGNQKSTAE